MNLPASLARRCAERLLDHAATVLPSDQVDWAQAMRAELSAVAAENGAVLAFAAGCVMAAYRRRLSPGRMLLGALRLSVAALALLTAAFHAFMPGYMAAVVLDLALNGMDGWAGRFRMFRGVTADQAIAGVLMMPAWHVGLMLATAAAFAACARFVARGQLRGLLVAVLAGAAVHTANTLLQLALWPTPYLVHPEIAWLNYLALALLLAAGLVFGGLDRWTRARTAAT